MAKETYHLTEEVAEMLRIHPRRVISLIDSGQLEAVNVGTGTRRRFRISPSQLESFLAARSGNKPMVERSKRVQGTVMHDYV